MGGYLARSQSSGPWVVLSFAIALSPPLAYSAAPNQTLVSAPGALPSVRPSLTPAEQAVYYRRAVENLSLQAKYIIDKMEALRTASDDATKRSILGRYCAAVGVDAVGAINDCEARYFQFQVLQLYRIKSAIVMNSDAEARLAGRLSAEMAPGTQAPGYQVPRPDGASPRPARVFYLPTYEEIQREDARMQYLNSNQYQQWANELPTEPAREDFVKFRRIPRDPSRPGAGSFLVVETGPDGTPAIDEQRYRAARQLYSNSSGYRDIVTHMRRNPVDLNSNRHLERLPPDERRRIYLNSRRDIVEVINQSIRGVERSDSLRASQQGRGPAARPTARPGAGSQFSTQVNIPTQSQGARAPTATPSHRHDATGQEQVQLPPPSDRGDDFSATYNPEDIQRYIDDVMH